MNRRKLSMDDIGILLFLSALIIGSFFRLAPPFSANFPINDGALFYKMIETVQNNGFKLPFYIEYNRLQIPFAYPPLAIYLAGVIGTLYSIPTLQIVLWMPAIVLIITLPFIFMLAKQLLNSTLSAGIAVLLYALLPRALTWLIMGGGVTRSPGNFFLILAISQIHLMFEKAQTKHIIGSVLFSALVCLTHPEAAMHTVIAALLLWFFYGRNKVGFRNGSIVGGGTIILTSPWWATILDRFGTGPFLAASRTGFHSPLSGFNIFNDFSEEAFITIIAVLAIQGIFVQIAKRQYFLPLWYILPFLAEPRNAPNVSIIPMAMLASISLTELVLPGLSGFELSSQRPSKSRLMISRLFLAYTLCALFIGMIKFEAELNQKRVSNDLQSTFEWIRNNTEPGAAFLIISGDADLFLDYANEWFPLLTRRRSHTTIQGYEWMEGIGFEERMKLITRIQLCAKEINAIDCVNSLTDQYALEYDYLAIRKGFAATGNIIFEMTQSDNFENIYNAHEITVFRKIK